ELALAEEHKGGREADLGGADVGHSGRKEAPRAVAADELEADDPAVPVDQHRDRPADLDPVRGHRQPQQLAFGARSHRQALLARRAAAKPRGLRRAARTAPAASRRAAPPRRPAPARSGAARAAARAAARYRA